MFDWPLMEEAGFPLIVILRILATLAGLVLIVLTAMGRASALAGMIGAVVVLVAVFYRRIFS